MMLGSRISRVLVAVTPLLALAACGDDTNPGSGGAGGAGTSSTGTPSTTISTGTGSPTSTSVASSSASSSSSDGGGGNNTTSNGGGGSTSEGGGGSTSEGGGGSTSEGGGGQAPALPIDGEDCDTPSEYDLEIGTVTKFEGDTNGAVDDYDTCDPDLEDGGDLVLTFTLPDAGSVRIELRDGDGLDGNLVFHGATCDSDVSEVCLAQAFFGNRKVYSTHLEAGTYSVIVDSAGDAEGPFELDISYQEPVCGDSVLNPGEECDVGAGVDNDQCGNPGAGDECQLQAPPDEPEQCPGEALPLDEGVNAFLASDGYSTLGFVDHSIGSCFVDTEGADRVIAITPTVTGTAVATIGYDANNEELICSQDLFSPGCWDQFLYVRTDCLVPDSEVACADDNGNGGEIVTFDVIEDEPIFLFVDGFDGEFYSQGPFNLFVTVTP